MKNIAISAGMAVNDFDKLRKVCEHIPDLDYICLDVANGYSEHFVDFIRKVREQFPRHTIFAGNVVTGEMVEELILSGADVVKVRRNLRLPRTVGCFRWASVRARCASLGRKPASATRS